jgi:hypothetical protein
MNTRICSLILVAAVALLPAVGTAQDRQPDEVTRALFEQYVARQAKINTESVMAATQLVADRGRTTGFWKVVLAELKSDNPNSEIGCIRVLGKMLATDAAARDTIKRQKETGEISAWIPSVHLGPEVVAELVKRGEKADRFRIDHYTIALARARVSESSDFFKAILRAEQSSGPPVQNAIRAPEDRPRGPYHLDSTRFHAAVGLAQLGEREGIDWLVAHSEYTEGTVSNGVPVGTPPGGSLYKCCREALRHLSLENTRTTHAEWAAWAKTVDSKSLVGRGVVFSDP